MGQIVFVDGIFGVVGWLLNGLGDLAPRLIIFETTLLCIAMKNSLSVY